MKYKIKVWKTLSRNDTGETNSHQSGISIVKDIAKAGIFPILTTDELNPRIDVVFYDEKGEKWSFKYIYYNDLFFGKEKGKGHDEFRLTCVKDFIRANNIIAGDEIWFAINESGERIIGFNKQNSPEDDDNDDVIVVRKGWKMINI